MVSWVSGPDDDLMDRLAEIRALQDGVIGRRQLLEVGRTRTQVARALRRRDLVAVHPGVHVEHTGPLTWQQRVWAAVLGAWPAALSHDSALRADEGPGRRARDEDVIHVAVDRHRHLAGLDGVRLHRMVGLDQRVQWNRAPPRVRHDQSVLDFASSARDDLAAVGVLAAACGSRRTTAARLLDTLGERERIARRDWLRDVLTDVAEGTCSVLEHGSLDRVVRPHGLPVGQLQAVHAGSNGSVYRDVDHPALGLVIELDGRLFHTSAADRDHDLERDLDVVVERGATTVRLGFWQVYSRSCSTARKVAAVMRRLGWVAERPGAGCAVAGINQADPIHRVVAPLFCSRPCAPRPCAPPTPCSRSSPRRRRGRRRPRR